MKDIIQTNNVFGTKSILLEQYPDSAWNWISGAPEDAVSVKALSEQVPWLFRGIRAIVQGVAEVPICLMKGDAEVGYIGDDFESPFLYTEDLPVLFKKIAASLVLEGRSYLFREKVKGANVALTTKKLWYWNPLTVTFDADKTRRQEAKEKLLYFKRMLPGYGEQEYTNKEVVYFWPDDPYVEVGPPLGSPAKAALKAAGVLYNIDTYVAKYFEMGAVRAYLFSKEGAPPSEEEQSKFFNKMNAAVMGLRNAFRGLFISGAVKTEKIGDGLDGLQDSELTKEKREDISTALGIPQSILWSTEAGGLGGAGVTTEDTYRFYRMNIVPSVRFIVDVINKQQLKDSGYRLDVRENDMDVFQEDENSRAGSMGSLVSALENPEEFLIAASILGYDLSDDTIKEIEKLGADRKEAAAQIQQNMTPKEEPPKEMEEEPENEAPDETAKRLATWRRYTLKHGKEKVSKFDTNGIGSELVARILRQVEMSTNDDELKAAFTVEKVDANPILEAMRIEMKHINAQVAPSQPTTIIVDTTGKSVETELKAGSDIVNAVNAMADRLDRQIVIPAPVVNVDTKSPVINVPAPVVNVTVEKQEPPIVNIEPAVVKVNMPKVKKTKQTVKRSQDGSMSGTETEYEY